MDKHYRTTQVLPFIDTCNLSYYCHITFSSIDTAMISSFWTFMDKNSTGFIEASTKVKLGVYIKLELIVAEIQGNGKLRH